MNVHAIQSSQPVAQTADVSKAQSAQKQVSQQSAIPEDRVTISSAAQAKQTGPSIGTDLDHDGK